MKLVRKISFLASCLAFLPSIAHAVDADELVKTFEQGCFNSVETVQEDWYAIAADFDPSLKSYYGTISDLLGDQITRAQHYAIFIDKRPVFLTRYHYEGQFGLSSDVCMVSDFSRDSWQFPQGLEAFLDGKTIATDHNVNISENEKSVGHWRAAKSLRPVTMIMASAYPKGGEHHEASKFYGVQLTATRLQTSETTTIN